MNKFDMIKEIFGEMRGLNKEEQESISKAIAEMSIDLGINIFDIWNKLDKKNDSKDNMK